MSTSSSPRIPGIHHISAICGDPQRNIDFYAGFLGLRLVKRTVNFDDPGIYHLYYGDGGGSLGTIMTFFAWVLPPAVRADGRQGTGQLTTTSFQIPPGSVDFWIGRLASADIDFEGPEERFDETVISFRDPDRLPLELVARHADGKRVPWPEGPIPLEHAIRGFAGATLSLKGYEQTAELLTETLGFRAGAREGSRYRFHVGEGIDTATLDLLCLPESQPGRMGIGVVHHIAWRVGSPADQLELREKLLSMGLDVTPVLDRKYFQSIYFSEPGGVIFEIATEAPGFTVDESIDELGTRLQLPAWLEPRRARLEARLPELRAPRTSRK